MFFEVKELRKTYPGGVKAVDGVSFGIPKGICFGLLGPNGAGKTTTLEMIEGITKPDSGEIFFEDKLADHRFRERIGIQFQETALPDYIRVREVLELFAQLYSRHAPIERVIEDCSLQELLERETDKLSGGQRQRLLLGLGLINDPDLIFLDEPTTGLDPQARRNFWDLVRGIKAKGKTVILTTHYMEEAYYLCDRIAIMDKGKIISEGTPDQLLRKHFSGVTVQLPKPDKALPAGLGKIHERDGLVEIHTERLRETLQGLLESGAELTGLQIRSATLEDLFVELTGRELRS